ncbi:alpha/beta hydrolase [Patescibacteria group bacterium]|nr:alpha/beta hydrolase [Patescibacteria group bacterium]
MEQRLEVKNKAGETLVGTYVVPKKGVNFPCVIMVHGFHYFKEEDGLFVETSRFLSDVGIASCRFDFSGCGESEGDYSETTLTKLKNDLSVIVNYVRKNLEIDKNRIGIFAQSFGTTVTVALSPKVKSIVLAGAFINPSDIFKQYFGKRYNPTGISVKNHTDGRITEIKPGFWKDFNNYNLMSELRKLNSSLLLIYGLEDDTIPLSSIEKIFMNANEPKEKLIIEGADHGLMPKRNLVYKVVSDWFKRTL